jgi:hypothetical protein
MPAIKDIEAHLKNNRLFKKLLWGFKLDPEGLLDGPINRKDKYSSTLLATLLKAKKAHNCSGIRLPGSADAVVDNYGFTETDYLHLIQATLDAGANPNVGLPQSHLEHPVQHVDQDTFPLLIRAGLLLGKNQVGELLLKGFLYTTLHSEEENGWGDPGWNVSLFTEVLDLDFSTVKRFEEIHFTFKRVPSYGYMSEIAPETITIAAITPQADSLLCKVAEYAAQQERLARDSKDAQEALNTIATWTAPQDKDVRYTIIKKNILSLGENILEYKNRVGLNIIDYKQRQPVIMQSAAFAPAIASTFATVVDSFASSASSFAIASGSASAAASSQPFSGLYDQSFSSSSPSVAVGASNATSRRAIIKAKRKAHSNPVAMADGCEDEQMATGVSAISLGFRD